MGRIPANSDHDIAHVNSVDKFLSLCRVTGGTWSSAKIQTFGPDGNGLNILIDGRSTRSVSNDNLL